jgi:hypothetical protein
MAKYAGWQIRIEGLSRSLPILRPSRLVYVQRGAAKRKGTSTRARASNRDVQLGGNQLVRVKLAAKWSRKVFGFAEKQK